MTDEQPAVAAARPRRYKQAIVTWLAVYPALTVTLYVLSPFTDGWPLWLRTLVVTILLVPVVVWVILPFLTRILRGWLFR